MAEASSTAQDRRPQHVAAFGFFLQLASFGTLTGVAFWSQSDAMATVARFMVIGLPIWAVLYLIFNQIRRVRTEQLESAELKRSQDASGASPIFELDDENLLVEQNKLRWMIVWFLPGVTVLLFAFLLIGHLVGWSWSLASLFEGPGAELSLRRTLQPTLMMWFVVGVGFLSFLYARYTIALAKLQNWALLRAGASCMVGNAIICLFFALSLMAGTTIAWAEPVFAYIIRWLLFMVGIEFAVNFILDFYRPHVADQVRRPSFDSRLLGLLSEPGGIAKSIAESVNYQFGFEVSSTWFYQLMQRWLFPILVATMVTVISLTSIVVVDADEQVVIERFGQLIQADEPVLESGLHFKLPWPIDKAYRAPVRRIHEMVIGEADEHDDEDPRKAILWTEKHDYVPELMLLVASKEAGEDRGQRAADAHDEVSKSVAVALLKVSIPIEYRIRDLRQFLYKYHDPEKIMEGIAYQYLQDYAASVDIDELMGPGRTAFNHALHERIQQRLDEQEVGIEVVFVGIRGAHPPAEKQVAAAFQYVVSARSAMASIINAAQGEARRILTEVAGTQSRAEELDAAIRRVDKLLAAKDADKTELAKRLSEADDLLLGNSEKGISRTGGEAAAMISEAKARSSDEISIAASKALAFNTEVAAFKAAPELYRARKVLEIYGDLDTVRKYLVIGDATNVNIVYETKQEGSLDRVLAEGLDGSK